MLTSTKNGYFCHSQHRNLASLRKRAPYPAVELSCQLAREKGITEGDWVRIVTASGSARLRAKLAKDMAPDVVVAEFGWWQACDEIGMGAAPVQGELNSNFSNLLTADHLDPISGSVPLRSIRCSVELNETVQARGWQGFRDFTVAAIVEEAEGVRGVMLEAADGDFVPNYLPGQHVTVHVPSLRNEMRSYSLTGAAIENDRRSYAIAVRHVRRETSSGKIEEGVISGHIHRELKVGQVVSLKPPSGVFIMPLQSKQPVVLFAGGIGITPFLSYLETLVRQSEAPRVWLFYANRSGRSHAFKRQIAALQERLPLLRVVNCYAQEEPGCDVSGRLSANMVDENLIQQRARFYFCGPKSMMNSITDQLVARGVPHSISSERYLNPPPCQASIQVKSLLSPSPGRTKQWNGRQTRVACFLLPSNAEYQFQVVAG